MVPEYVASGNASRVMVACCPMDKAPTSVSSTFFKYEVLGSATENTAVAGVDVDAGNRGVDMGDDAGYRSYQRCKLQRQMFEFDISTAFSRIPLVFSRIRLTVSLNASFGVLPS